MIFIALAIRGATFPTQWIASLTHPHPIFNPCNFVLVPLSFHIVAKINV